MQPASLQVLRVTVFHQVIFTSSWSFFGILYPLGRHEPDVRYVLCIIIIWFAVLLFPFLSAIDDQCSSATRCRHTSHHYLGPWPSLDVE
jgi:hypothetical protein